VTVVQQAGGRNSCIERTDEHVVELAHGFHGLSDHMLNDFEAAGTCAEHSASELAETAPAKWMPPEREL